MKETTTPDRPTSHSRLSLGARWAIAAGALVVIAIVAVAIAAPALSPYVKSRITRTLEENFASRLELKNLEVSLFPSVRVSGDGLVLRQRDGGDIPPLIMVSHFTAETNLLSGLFSRVERVKLDGLQIHIQTGHDKQPGGGTHKKPPGFTIAEVIADGTRLETIPSKPGKDPLVWDIKKLKLHHVTPDSPMSFDATLTNALPPGDIQSSGNFGPWQREHPSQTPVSGNYTFRHADLSVFHGISGILSSDGKYNGVLERIEAQGHTDTPGLRRVDRRESGGHGYRFSRHHRRNQRDHPASAGDREIRAFHFNSERDYRYHTRPAGQSNLARCPSGQWAFGRHAADGRKRKAAHDRQDCVSHQIGDSSP